MRTRKVAETQIDASQNVGQVRTSPSAPAPSTSQGPQMQRGGFAGGDVGGLAAADATALYGTRRAKVPDLLGDWKKAVVDATVVELAEGLIQPHVDAALANADQSAQQTEGRGLTRREARSVIHQVHKAHMPAAIAQVEPGVRADEPKAYDEAIKRWRPQLPNKKDLSPMVLDAPGARANEVVLWESARALVVVDVFADGPKALVFPKPPVDLPIDLSKTDMAYIAKVAAQVGAAFRDLDGQAKPEIWVNPPQDLMVRQMHVHVAPKLANWEDVAPTEQAAARMAQAFYGSLQAHIARRLGPSG